METLLKRFCSKDSTRLKLLEPFSIGKYSYATDGYSLIRINKIEGMEEKEDCIPVDKNLPWDHENIEGWVSLPQYEIDISDKCSYCEGTGKSENCPECDEEGFVEFENAYNYYEIECKSCKGNRIVVSETQSCSVCDGSCYNLSTPIYWERGKINMRFLERIKTLPGIMLSTYGESRDPIRFRFDGGCGHIVPMRDD